MSALKRLFSRQTKGSTEEFNIGDPELGNLKPLPDQPTNTRQTPSPLHQPNTAVTHTMRTSVSDSKFSQSQDPISLQRYGDALEVMKSDSTRSLPSFKPLISKDTVRQEVTGEEGAVMVSRTIRIGQQNMLATSSVGTKSFENESDLAWSSPQSSDVGKNANTDSHSYQHANVSAKPGTSADGPRRVAGAGHRTDIDLAPSSSRSVSTNILNTSSQSAETSAHPIDNGRLSLGTASSLSRFYSSSPDASSIDVEIPKASLDSGSGSNSHSDSISHYSGFVVEDTGFRQMSPLEAEAELQASMRSLGEVTGTGQKMEQPSVHLLLPPRQFSGQRMAALDPGSSQSSSSRSANWLTESIVNSSGNVGLNKDFSSANVRSPTPPLLYGRQTMPSVVLEDTDTKARTQLPSYTVEDWETVSDMKSHTRGLNNETFDSQTGSSLADNSDVGDISAIEPQTCGPRKLGVSQHPGLPRPHQTVILMKDNRLGSPTNVPVRDYRHPSPLNDNHENPFISSPPDLNARSPNEIARHSATLARQVSQQRVSAKSNSTGGFDKLVELYGSTNIAHNGQNVANVPKGTVNPDKQQTTPKEPSPESSAWLSTVSESVSGEDGSVALRHGSFAKVTVLNSRANITGTPEGTGAREVGSSLVGSSSPIDPSSSSPVANVDSTRLLSSENTPPRTPYQQAAAHPSTPLKASSSDVSGISFHPSPQTISYHKTLGRSFATPDDVSIYSSLAPSLSEYSFVSSDAQSRLTARARAFKLESPPSQRRRRSSSESNCKVIASPSITKASALQSPNLHSHRQRNTTTGLLSSYSPFDDAQSEDSQQQATMRERQAPTEKGQTSKSNTSRAQRSVQIDGVSRSNVTSPKFEQALTTRQQQLGSLPFRLHGLEPAAVRGESPHLYITPCPPTAEFLERQKQISKLWLPVFCIIPPCGLIFGYGFADEIILHQSGGEVNTFTEWSKMFAILWALSATPIIIVVVVVSVVYGSSN